MAAKSFELIFSENFSKNLESVRHFLEPKSNKAFRGLLDRLFVDVFPTLSEFPQTGRSFLAHSIGSLEAKKLINTLKEMLQRGDDLREFIFDDYLLLYLIRGKRIVLLSIKHHKQLTFDLARFWG